MAGKKLTKKVKTFTPGPHIIGYVDKTNATISVQTAGRRKSIDANGGMIISIYYGPDIKENALLGSAAPDLYWALEELTRRFELENITDNGTCNCNQFIDSDDDECRHTRAFDALRKARGEY